MKRDLLFILEKLVGLLDENRVEMLARQHGIRQKRDDGGVGKTVLPSSAAPMKVRFHGCWSRQPSFSQPHAPMQPRVLRDAAAAYKVDTDAITLKVKQEFAAKAKAKRDAKPASKAQRKQPSPSLLRGAATCRLSFLAAEIAQRETLLVSPCTLIPHDGNSELYRVSRNAFAHWPRS